MLIAVTTSMVTVTVPPEAIVTLPANAPLPETLKLAVLALPLTALATRASVVLKFAGMLSLRLPVSVPGPSVAHHQREAGGQVLGHGHAAHQLARRDVDHVDHRAGHRTWSRPG